jgi:hypothetical protein
MEQEQPKSDSYYKARIEAERLAAAAATCPQARRAHEEMALAYQQRVDGFVERVQAPIRSSKIR